MNERTVSRIEGWDARPYSGGYAALQEFADGDFTGAVRSGGTWLFMLNGRVVGVHEGTIGDFEGAEGTAYQAPHPSLPLLFTMREEGGERRAKYYTNDTPISEAHSQLSDASFTGYIELSENVLSGDYYVLYYGGRSMSCAFVGNSERLETGDEAFQLADEEVGIYEVRTVDVDVVDVPEPAGTSNTQPAAEAGDPAGSGGASEAVDAPGTTEATESGDAPEASEPAGAGSEAPGSSEASAAGTDERASAAGTDERASASRPEEGESVADGQPTSGAAETDRSDSGGSGVRDGAATSPADVRDGGPVAGNADAAMDDGTGSSSATPASATTGGPPDQADSADADASSGAPETSTTDATGREVGEPASSESAAAEPTSSESVATEPTSSESVATEPTSSESAPRTETTAERGRVANEGSARASDGSVRESTRGEASGSVGASTRSSRTASSASGSATERGVLKSQVGDIDLEVIPSLSPDRTRVAEPGAEAAVEDATGGSDDSPPPTGTGRDSGGRSGIDGGTGRDATGAVGAGSDARSAGVSAGPSRAKSGGEGSETRAASGADVSDPGSGVDDATELRRELQARQERIGELEASLADLRVQRDGLTDERDRLQSEVSRLESEVDELQEEVDRLRARLNGGSEGKKRLTPEQAMEGTNLFIRYDSKTGGTLENAHAGEIGPEEVNENLRIEHHTQFDAGGVVVDGDDFETFLSNSIYRSFVGWVVRELLYEIRETGHAKGLRELYDAIPQIDRAELLGEASVQYTEDGEQYREQRSFDVVLRNRMGNPLIVANLNDSRNPADREMMETILTHAGDVETSNESLSSAVMVTSSFFQPGALEAAEEAVGGGFLSRDSKESYVKTTRKSGYHLILVESRSGEFHINVPEL